MKLKKLFVLGLVMGSCLLSGCRGDKDRLSAGDLERNTLSVSKKGLIQDAMVETFDKSYYSDGELKEYLEGVVASYNNTAGKDSVTMDSFKVEDGTASAVFTYQNIGHYKSLTESELAYQTLDDMEGELAGDFLDMEGNTISLDDIKGIKDASKYNVLVLQDAFDVIVEGTIQYYSNCDVLGDSSVHTQGDAASVIIFK